MSRENPEAERHGADDEDQQEETVEHSGYQHPLRPLLVPFSPVPVVVFYRLQHPEKAPEVLAKEGRGAEAGFVIFSVVLFAMFRVILRDFWPVICYRVLTEKRIVNLQLKLKWEVA